jgi:phage portal protein BeeE
LATLFRSLFSSARESRDLSTVDDYLAATSAMNYYGGLDYGSPGLTGTWERHVAERIPGDFEGLVRGAYAANGIVWACMAVRMAVFSTVRFAWQRLNAGQPSELFGSRDLALLETPWPGGTTQDLLARLIQDADLAGNSYWTRIDDQLVRLRPDWVQIVMAPRVVRGVQVGWERLGYAYWEHGVGASDPATFLADEVAHFAPSPDPLATYRGMSWLTPVIREVTNDKAMNAHKDRFLANAATPNLSIALDKDVRHEAFLRFRDSMNASHKGVQNAGKTLFLGGGADVKVIGADLKQLDFKVVQAAGETRLAAAAGVPPMIAGLSEGLQGTSYAMYSAARRRFADGTMHPLWANAAGSLASLVAAPPRGSPARLWFDPRDVPFLREDRKDAAEILQTQAAVIRSLIETGYDPDAVVRMVSGEDLDLLMGQHSGMVSVQLQRPGAQTPGNVPGGGANAEPDASA